MGRQVTRVTMDTYVYSMAPMFNHGTTTMLSIGGSATGRRAAYIYFPRMFPVGATIRRAELHLWSSQALPSAGTRTLSAARVNGGWSETGLTWQNKPPTTGTSGTASKTGAVATNTEWVVDVAAQLQVLADAPQGNWYGFRLDGSWTDTAYFFSRNSIFADYQPYVIVEWDDRPDKPERLSPAGGRLVSIPKPVLRCDFTDVSGNTAMQAIHVRTFTSEANAKAMTPIDWDSGVVPSGVPQLDLAATSFTALTAGVTRWWRVRVQDGAGLWSEWSDPEAFGYQPLPTIVLDNPDANQTVGDVTPIIMWHTSPAGAQVTRQVRLLSPRGWRLWDSGVKATTDTFVTIPAGIIMDSATYRLEVSVWDSASRESTPGAPAAAYVSTTFAYAPDPTKDKPTSLAAVQGQIGPSVDLTWKAPYAADSWTILRDGRVIASGLTSPGTYNAATDSYRWTDPAAPMGIPITYAVRAVIGGVSSESRTAAPVTVEAAGTWLVDPSGECLPLCVFGQDPGQWGLAEDSSWHRPYGAPRPLVITQTIGGTTGTVSGELLTDAAAKGVPAGMTANDWLRRAFEMRKRPGRTWTLVSGRACMPVLVRNFQYGLLSDDNTQYSVSFEFADVNPLL